jgi:AraC-like DNA-binding protein
MKHFKTISEFHAFVGLPAPHHPLISVINVADVPQAPAHDPFNMVMDFYSISVKRMGNVWITYGQESFDFNEGILSFMAPRQVFSISVHNKDEEIRRSGWVIYMHPDFIWNTPLAKTIRGFDFWDYSLREALFLSAKEEGVVNGIGQNIQTELDANIDKFSKHIIIAQLESLLHYADRFYHRQFITREKANHQVLDSLNDLLDAYFNGDDAGSRGLPTVRLLAEALHLSPKYLSNLLKMQTGQSAQQHIHDRLIGKAKERLSTTTLTVSEIAYQLGFEHLQSFSKLFKSKTTLSPIDFRKSFTTN